MSMWGDDSGGHDMSHLYLGMAMGSARRANRAEDDNDKLFAAIGDAQANTIAWQAISRAYQQLCEAMLDELASCEAAKELSNPSHPYARNLFLRNAVAQAMSVGTKLHQDNGNAKKWPHMLSKAKSIATMKAMDLTYKMDAHALGHFEEECRRTGSTSRRNR